MKFIRLPDEKLKPLKDLAVGDTFLMVGDSLQQVYMKCASYVPIQTKEGLSPIINLQTGDITYGSNDHFYIQVFIELREITP